MRAVVALVPALVGGCLWGWDGTPKDADGDGYVASEDCDDARAGVSPDADESCNGRDDDCDGDIDEALPMRTWYRDADSDTVGSVAETVTGCGDDPPEGYVAQAGDCNDSDPGVYPKAPERCNGLDDDCNPATTENGRVSVAGGGTFTSVAAAVAAAGAGAVVLVCEGTYLGNVVVERSLVLQAEPHVARPPVLDALGTGSVVEVRSGASLTLEGVVLRGGSGTARNSTAAEVAGGGLYVDSGGDIALTRVRMEDNTAQVGGGLFIDEATSLTLVESTLAFNEATDGGGGAWLWGVPEVTLVGVSIADNRAGHGGGVRVSDTLGSVFVDADAATTVVGNIATGTGGGLYVSGTWYGGVIAENRAEGTSGNGGGAYVGAGGSFHDAVFRDNWAAVGGGGIYVGGSAELVGLLVEDNVAEVRGGGIGLLSGSAWTITDTTVRRNACLSDGECFGGGLRIAAGTATLTGVQVTDNVTTGRGGGLYVLAGIVAAGDGVEIRFNDALHGGGVYLDGATSTSERARLQGGSVSNNRATLRGGGIYLVNGADLTRGPFVGGNTAGELGGGVYSSTDASLTGAVIESNVALKGGGLAVGGSQTDVHGGSFDGNVAALHGGGLYVTGGRATTDGTAFGANTPVDVYLEPDRAYTCASPTCSYTCNDNTDAGSCTLP